MAKITLDSILSGFNLSKLNANQDKVEAEFQDKVLYRNNPTGEPNSMENDLDMNSHRILNLAAPVSDTDPVRGIDLSPFSVSENTKLFSTKTALRLAEGLVVGEIVQTSNASSPGDRGGATYKVIADSTYTDGVGGWIEGQNYLQGQGVQLELVDLERKFFDSITDLAALTVVEGVSARVNSGGRAGPFRATTADISTEVTADPQQGVYVAFASDPTGASGGWVRQYGQAVSTAPPLEAAWFGMASTEATDSAAIKAAINFAEAKWQPVVLPAGRVYWDSSAINNNYVKLWGQGAPVADSGKTTLVGGTIIEGGIICSGDYIDLRDFGVDLGSATSAPDIDGIKCTASPVNTGVSLHTENLTALCKSPASAVHALLFEGYASHTGGNIHGIYGFFGCVIKNRGVELTTVSSTESSDTGLYLKSDDTFGQCRDVQIGQVNIQGSCTYAVRMQADSAEMDAIYIGSIRAKDHDTTLLVQTLNDPGASFGTAHVGSILSENAAADDIFVYNLKPSGLLENVTIGSIVSINPAAKVINLLNEPSAEIDSVNIGSVYSSYDAATADAVLDGAVFVGSRVNRTEIGHASLLVDGGRSSKLGAINYTDTGDHVLGSRRARLITPTNLNNGYDVQALSGATADVAVPRNTSGDNRSFVKLTHSAPITITSFTPPTDDAGFSIGHVLYLFNAAADTATVANNAPGKIVNKGFASVVIANNEVKAWVMADDEVWREIPG